MSNKAVAAALIAASLGGGVGYGLGSAASPQPADAASGNTDVVRQLKKLDTDLTGQLRQTNGQMKAVNEKLGTPADKGTVRWLLTTICNYTASIDCG